MVWKWVLAIALTPGMETFNLTLELCRTWMLTTCEPIHRPRKYLNTRAVETVGILIETVGARPWWVARYCAGVRLSSASVGGESLADLVSPLPKPGLRWDAGCGTFWCENQSNPRSYLILSS